MSGSSQPAPEIRVVRVRALESLNDPVMLEKIERARQAYEAMSEVARRVIDAHDRALFRAFLFGGHEPLELSLDAGPPDDLLAGPCD